VHKGVWKVSQCKNLITLVILCLFLFSSPIANATELTTDFEQAKEIAKQAYIFAYPMLEDFKTMFIQAIDPGLFSMFYHKRELRDLITEKLSGRITTASIPGSGSTLDRSLLL
jgi:hypothetical protein